MRRRDALRVVSSAFLGLAARAQVRKKKLLYFTLSSGFEHSVVKRVGGKPSHSERCLMEMGRRAGFEVESTKDGRVFDRGLDAYDAVVFYTSGDLTQAGKDGGVPMTPAGKQRLLDAVSGGKAFVGFHAASDTFHSAGPRDRAQAQVDPYIAMLGGEFVTHGEQQEASVVLTSRFPGAGSLGCAEALAFTEEWYTHKNFAPDLHVILAQETQMMKGDCYRRPDFPITWARRHGLGRVFYTSLGHREDVWTNPFFQAIALGGIAWALGEAEYDIKPNLKEATPFAGRLAL